MEVQNKQGEGASPISFLQSMAHCANTQNSMLKGVEAGEDETTSDWLNP